MHPVHRTGSGNKAGMLALVEEGVIKVLRNMKATEYVKDSGREV